MFIDLVIIEDYNRMKSNSFKRLEYRPTDKVQIILGTNGYGKSSLLAELSPLPADLNKYYGDNGYKEVRVKHNGDTFILISSKKTGKHSFSKNGENLNVGGTRKVQLQLCLEYFNITPEIHKVLLGTTKFTEMPVSMRKKWFRNISTVDYTYGLRVYDKVNTEYRDIIGGVKLLQVRLSETSSTMLTTEVEKELTIKSNNLRKFIEFLLTKKQDVLDIPSTNIDHIHIGNTLTSNRFTQGFNTDIVTIDKSLTMITSRIDYTNTNIKNMLETITSLEDKKTNTKHVDKTLLEELQGTVKRLKDIIGNYIPTNDIKAVTDVLTTYRTKYIEDVLIVKSNTDIDGIRNYVELNIELSNINLELAELSIKLERLRGIETEMSNNKTNDDVTCNKCGNIWTLDYDKGNHTIVMDKISKINIDINKLTLNNDKLKNRLDNLNNVKSSISNIESLLSVLPQYAYDMIIANIETDITKIDNNIIKLYNKLVLVKDLPRLENELSILIETSRVSDDSSKDIISKIDIDIIKYTKALNGLYRYKSRLTHNLNVTRTLYDNVTKLNEMKDEYIEYLDNREELEKIDLIKSNNEYIDTIIGFVKTDLSSIDKQLSTHAFNKQTIENIRIDISNLTLRKNALHVVLKALSPTGGLIGKSISGYLAYFTSKMNIIVNSLWSYRLTIKPCSISDGDLDYKFPFNSDDKVFGYDVSEMSTSMKEVVDLAFKLTSMDSLGLTDYTLFLDEYASSFDPVHRLNAYDRVEELKDKYSQMFIISHYSEVFGRFKDAEVVVISKDNLFLDDIKEYNTNIVYD